MLRPVKIATTNFFRLLGFGIRGLYLEFRVWDSEYGMHTILFHHLIIGLRGVTGQNDI